MKKSGKIIRLNNSWFLMIERADTDNDGLCIWTIIIQYYN
jgi:hypothetical protein